MAMMRGTIYALTVLLTLPSAIRQEDIDRRERELTEIRQKLLKCRKEKTLLQGKETSLLQKLEGIDRELNLTQRMLAQLKEKETRTAREIKTTERRIKNAGGRLEKKEEIFQKRLVAIYKSGKLHPLEILFSTRNFTDGFRRMKYLTLIARQDRRVCSQILSLRGRLEQEKRRLASKLEELKGVKEETQSEEANLEVEKDKKGKLLSGVRNKKEEQERIARELREAEKKLQTLIEELERKRHEELARGERGEGTRYFETHKGGLIWPTEGEVISNFGKQFHPRYGTSTRNNGIDIRAPRNSPVVAVGDGTVAYADRFLGYGEIALIDHGGGFYTLYSHLSQCLVEAGDEVRKGDLIAKVGETGSLEGPVLHFELRVDGKPVDPLLWLKRR